MPVDDRTSRQSPDLILHAGTVLGTRTFVPGAGERPTAVAVTGGLVSAVGDEQLCDLAGPGTRVMDVEGSAILPGINDGHLHFTATAMVKYGYASVGNAGTWSGVAEILRAMPVGEDGWIRAHGWDDATFGPQGPELIASCRPDVPVVVFDQTGHQLIANQKALDVAGIHAATLQPPGGVIERDAAGGPTGLLQDGAMALLTRSLPAIPRRQLRSAMVQTQEMLNGQGITSLTEPGLGPGSPGLFDGSGTSDALHLLGDLALDSVLSLRLSVLMLFAGTGGASASVIQEGLKSGLAEAYTSRGIDPQRLRIAGVKVFADGIPRSNTAWMSQPYGDQCTHGALVVAGMSEEERVAELARILSLIHDAGLQAGIHATGDAATETAIEQLIAIQQGQSQRDQRHYIIHGSFSSNAALQRMARHRIGYSTNPLLRSMAGDLMRRILGTERFNRHQPLNSALKAGVVVNLASDAPVTATDWRQTVIAAVTRNTIQQTATADDQERIRGLDALAAMTALPAWQDHAEGYKGTLDAGMAADLCVLDGPWPDDADIASLADREAILTLSNGKPVHDLVGTSIH